MSPRVLVGLISIALTAGAGCSGDNGAIPQDTPRFRWDDVEATWAPDSRRIAFASYRPNGSNRGSEIYVIDTGTNTVRRLTAALGDQGEPAWSVDGSAIAYVSVADGGRNDIVVQRQGDIHVMRADGSHNRRLTRTGRDSSPSWSPDGSQIAFIRARDESATSPDDLYVMRSDGNGQRRLAENATYFAWSPDGQRLAYASIADGDVHVVDVASGREVNVTRELHAAIQGVFYSVRPSWSPDGGELAVGADALDEGVYILSADGKRWRHVAAYPCVANPQWIDQTRLVCDEDARGEGGGIYVVNSATGARRQIAKDGISPRVSPDKRTVVFELGDSYGYKDLSSTHALALVGTDGRGHRMLTQRAAARG